MITEYLKEQFFDLINTYVSTSHLLLVASWKALQYAKW